MVVFFILRSRNLPPATSYFLCVGLCVCYFSVCVPYLWWLGSICVDLTEEIPRLIPLSCLACINLLNRAKTLVQKYQLYQPMPSRIQKPHTTSQEHNKRTNKCKHTVFTPNLSEKAFRSLHPGKHPTAASFSIIVRWNYSMKCDEESKKFLLTVI